tara:strand:+ start:1057 stop:1614 length:558 start_codon:yes stop_codon:yes gene_type:complete
MDSLQKTIYKTLPQGIKMEIINNPEKYPEYNQVVDRLNKEMIEEKASKIKSKVKLTKNRLALMSVLLSMYYHIKSYPPEKTYGPRGSIVGKYKDIKAWEDFSKISYPEYEEEMEHVELWPKYMFLIYYTYLISYEKWYNLKLETQIARYALPFNRKTDKLIDYIYKTYHHLDENISLDLFRDFGY